VVLARIDDPDDSRLTLYRGLRDADLRRRLEEDHGVFVVEGARSVRTLLEMSWPVQSLLLLPERVAALTDAVQTACQRGVPVYVASRAVLDGVAGFPFHRGVLALVERQPLPDPEAVLRGAAAVVVVERINDHENMGAIFRNAAALGAQAVLLDPQSCDPLYRRSVRVSVGHVLRVPFGRLTPWPEALTGLGALGFTVVALDPAGAETIDSVETGPRVAVLAGGESSGLSEGARRAAAHRVRIPMATGVDSLNVATAVAVALHRLAPMAPIPPIPPIPPSGQ
jgi:tRNA G18 (ribose-2'-O)-methylase SpoU